MITAWRRDGCVVLENFFDPGELAPLAPICDRVHAAMCEEDEAWRDSTNIAYLTEPRFFEGRPDELSTLLRFIAHPRLLALIAPLGEEAPLFHNTQYFREPARTSRPGDWHRDTQFLAPDPELERERIFEPPGLHVRVAFEPDDALEYVPGSHRRWDTAEELERRKGPDPSGGALPGARTVGLQPGDVGLFHGWGIHRGHYRCGRPRRTLDLLYGLGGPFLHAPPPATCFREPGVLAPLEPDARRFFEAFVAAYEGEW